jgi:protein TonB
MPEKTPESVFGSTLTISGLLHALALVLVVSFTAAQPAPVYTPLAVMDFSQYDPEGGSPGSADTPEEIPIPPAPEPEPEPVEPELVPEVAESISEEAPVIPPPPPPEKRPNKRPPIKRERVPGPPAPVAQGPPGEGRGGSGGGTGRGNPDLLSAYKARISLRLNQYKKYPPEAMSKGLKGIATVSFRISAQGRVSASRLTKSSGETVLDQEALALLRRSSPFPPIPVELGLGSLDLNVPISFSARR